MVKAHQSQSCWMLRQSHFQRAFAVATPGCLLHHPHNFEIHRILGNHRRVSSESGSIASYHQGPTPFDTPAFCHPRSLDPYGWSHQAISQHLQDRPSDWIFGIDSSDSDYSRVSLLLCCCLWCLLLLWLSAYTAPHMEWIHHRMVSGFDWMIRICSLPDIFHQQALAHLRKSCLSSYPYRHLHRHHDFALYL